MVNLRACLSGNQWDGDVMKSAREYEVIFVAYVAPTESDTFTRFRLIFCNGDDVHKSVQCKWLSETNNSIVVVEVQFVPLKLIKTDQEQQQ